MANNLFKNDACEQAIQKISEGDYSALTVLYDSVGRLIFSIAFSILGDYQLSEDAMHDTFSKIADKAITYRRGSAKAWIASICRNIALNTLEKRNHELSTESINVTNNYLIDDELIMSVTLHDALALLTVQEKEIIIYKTMWTLKHKQIAQLMNLSVDNVRQRYKRTLGKLRAYYDDEGEKSDVQR